jgi:hypothetical protein
MKKSILFMILSVVTLSSLKAQKKSKTMKANSKIEGIKELNNYQNATWRITPEAKADVLSCSCKEESLMISQEEAIDIAWKDAKLVYKDLTIYEVRAEVKENNWLINYEHKNKELHGGGPHYVISGSTGEIVEKRYEQ